MLPLDPWRPPVRSLECASVRRRAAWQYGLRSRELGAAFDELFRVRHEVFCGGGYMPARHDGRIIERFDTFPGAVNIVAKADGRIIGNMRLDMPSWCGVGADEYFDYSALGLPFESTGGVSGDSVLLANYPCDQRRAYDDVEDAHLHRRAKGPQRFSAARRIRSGRISTSDSAFATIAPQLHDDESGLDVVPMTLEIAHTSESRRGFIDHQELGGFDEAFEHALRIRPASGYSKPARTDAKPSLLWKARARLVPYRDGA